VEIKLLITKITSYGYYEVAQVLDYKMELL
jgi:hypothetical protein